METLGQKMSGTPITLPVCLLILAVLIKLFVNRKPVPIDFILAGLELPVDLAFLTTALIAGFSISNAANAENHFTIFIVFLCATIGIVAIWRLSQYLFYDNKFFISIPLGILNNVISTYGFYYVVWVVFGAKGGA